MNLYSVCPVCPFKAEPYDGTRTFGDFDKCPKCGGVMDVWTERSVREQNLREELESPAIPARVGTPGESS